MKNKKSLIVILSVLAVSLIVIGIIIRPNVNEVTVKNEEKTVEKNGEVITKPTFMYFATSEELEQNKTVLDNLESRYGNDIIFDIKNAEKDKEVVKNFSFVEGNTPTLIVLDSNNDIKNILFKASDEEQLNGAIEEVISNENGDNE